MWRIAEEYWKEYLVFAIVACAFGIAPFAQTIYELGWDWYAAPQTVYVGGTYYSDRMQEIVDGHPLIGNPYFLEHREEFPPAFFVADWLGSIPLFLGLPMVPALVGNIVIWSFALFIFSHAILVTLGVSSRVSVIGSVVLGLQVYAQMVQAVSMQIVYPFFLLFMYGFLLWLENPHERMRQIGFAVSTALCAYIYTYSIQLVAVVYALTGLWVMLRERALLSSYIRTSVIGVVLCLPLIAFTLMQIQHEWYFETLERIGLIHTHIPVTLAFYVTLVPMAFLALALLIRGTAMLRARRLSQPEFFLVNIGLSLVIVMFSNVITGTDLELPQHIERFVVPWLMFAALFVLTRYGARLGELSRQFPKNIGVAACLLVIAYTMVLHLVNAGPRLTDRPMRTPADIERLAGLDVPLQWLRDNVQEPAVIWAEPDGLLNNRIPTFTQHYVLFEPKGVLQLLTNTEMEERYLLAHYFALDRDEIVREYVQYAGTGNAVHAHKTHNKRVKICTLLKLKTDCGREMSMEAYKGAEYFDSLLAKYENEIRANLSEWLRRYNVSYIIKDTETDSPSFQPSELPNAVEMYRDSRFTIYKLD